MGASVEVVGWLRGAGGGLVGDGGRRLRDRRGVDADLLSPARGPGLSLVPAALVNAGVDGAQVEVDGFVGGDVVQGHIAVAPPSVDHRVVGKVPVRPATAARAATVALMQETSAR